SDPLSILDDRDFRASYRLKGPVRSFIGSDRFFRYAGLFRERGADQDEDRPDGASDKARHLAHSLGANRQLIVLSGGSFGRHCLTALDCLREPTAAAWLDVGEAFRS